MRFLPVCALLLLAACGSQSRYDYDDPWDGYDPTVRRPTYDETYVPPSEMSADQLVERAIKAESRGRDDQARVDYHQAFRRDRWHWQANERYQDLMLRNGLFEDVWQEYLDLWQQHPERGDAFWFHLRPMLLERGPDFKSVRYRELSDEQARQIDQLIAESTTAGQDGDVSAAVESLDKALEIADLPELHRIRIELLHPGDYQTLLDEYAEHAEENPASGDALFMHAYALSMRDAQGALKLLRDGWILDLPGYWLRFGLGDICMQLGDDAFQQGNKTEARGWYSVAKAFLEHCVQSDPEHEEAATKLDWATRRQTVQ